MITETSSKNELLAAIDETISKMANLLSLLDETEINAIPYKDSWTAAQVSRHVSKSIKGMAAAMLKKSKPAERNPGEMIEGLKKRFLDFSTKMQSPEFIIPEEGPYQKQYSIDELNSSGEKFKENADKANLNDIVEGLPFGPVTKLELLHFVLYHTQRHLQQMDKIYKALKK